MARSTDGRWDRQCQRAACGKIFTARRPKQAYCSRECSDADRLAWARPVGGTRLPPDLGMRVCPNPGCPREGEPFQPTRFNQRACSRRCRDALPDRRAAQHAADIDPDRQERQEELRGLRRTEDPVRYRYQTLRSNLHRIGIDLSWERFCELTADGRGDLCELCGRPPASKSLHFDHDAATLEFRGWLCHNCNRGIGFLKHDPALLRAAAEYIERHRSAARVR